METGQDSQPTLSETISSVYDEVTAPKGEDAATAEQTSASEEAAPVTSDSDDKTTDDRPRDEAGRFITKDTDHSEETGGEAPPEPIDPPVSWSAAVRESWSTLPRQIQDEIAKREADVSRGFTQHSERIKQYEPLDQVLEPVRTGLGASGISEAQYVGQLVAADAYLREKPAEAIQWLAQSYGVDLGQVVTPANGQDEELTPELAKIADLQRRIDEQDRRWQQTAQANQQQAMARVNEQIEAFKAEPGHDHFEDVKDDMAALLSNGRAKDLADAYDKAVYANPETRAKLLTAQAETAERQRREEASRKAEEAKKIAATNIRGSEAGAGKSVGTVRSSIEEAYDNVVGTA